MRARAVPRPAGRRRSAKPLQKARIGWREWASLPELGVARIQVKIDTGARTSALHVTSIEPDGTERLADGRPQDFARIRIPLGGRHGRTVEARVPIAGWTIIKNTGGTREVRPKIVTEICIGPIRRRIEITLTDRRTLLYRMIIGRRALRGTVTVDPSRTFLLTPKKPPSE